MIEKWAWSCIPSKSLPDGKPASEHLSKGKGPPMCSIRFLLFLLVLIAWSPRWQVIAAESVKPFEQSDTLAIPCPVMPEKSARGRYSLVHDGRTYYFCCADCLSDFRTYPARYLNVKKTAEIRESPWSPGIELLVGIPLLVLLIGALMTRRTRRPLWSIAGTSAIVFAVLATVRFLAAERTLALRENELAIEHSKRVELTARDFFNYALPFDFGEPPEPSRPSGKDNRTTRVFFRGNDERTAKLWNGGHYRTCTFTVRFIDAVGKTLTEDNRPTAFPIAIEVIIERSPFTAEGFWQEAVMRTMFLTNSYAPLDRDAPSSIMRVPVETLEPLQRFRAVMPVLPAAQHQAEGTLYLCEHLSYQSIAGSRYHFAIPYRLVLRDGLVTADSDVWMGALYRTRRVPHWRLPLAEWFSDQPIPELPGPQTTTDPTALGLPDYPASGGR